MEKEKIISIYKDSVKFAQSAYENKRFSKSIAYCRFSAYVALLYPFLKNFTDDNLENIVSSIAHNNQQIDYIPHDDRLVFYNGQIVDNGALTEQYLYYFIENNMKVLFIIPEIQNTKFGKSILDKINKAPNITLYISTNRNDLDKIKNIREQLANYKAKYFFLHFLTHDVVGCIAFQNIATSISFYIVHNDHTFWLGKNFFDYFIEFRNFGISLAVERRGIPNEKILHIPFYPIRNGIQFNGFPFDRKNKIIGVSGANLYKYFVDPELKYFQIIKELLVENPNFIFCLCGWGDEEHIKKFIENNKLTDNFYFVGHRSDFYSLIGKCDILFESYPLKGGLTPLFATEQKIPVVGITSYSNYSGSLEEFLDINEYKQPANFEAFKTEATKLIQDEKYRKWLGDHLSKNRFNKNDFNASLKKIFDNNIGNLKPKHILKLRLNDDEYLQEYLSLAESTVENLMRDKLFLMKSSLPLFSRIKLMCPALKASGAKGIYGKFRVVFLVLFGY
jgi:glycosyltransferase involved in cell wall biosynthesis